jgi:hypothetical protein
MEPDELFDPIDTDPIVPDKLLDRTIKYLPSLLRVDVERKRGTNSWKKVNGFKADASMGGDLESTVESVCGMIVMIAQSDHEEHGGTEHYRAKYHVRAKNGQVQRKTFAFKLTDESDEPEPTLDKLEEQEVLAVAFDRAISLIEIQNRHIDSILGQMHSQATTQAGQTAPLLQTIETLVSKYHEGLNMQATALQAVSEMERSTKEAELKAERDKALIDILAVAAPKAFEQFGSYLGKKKAAEEGGEGEEGSEPIQSDPQKPEPQAQKPRQERPRSDAGQEDTVENNATETENPLTLFAHAFRDSIQSEQWLKLAEALSKQELKLLKDATTAHDDEATAEGVLAFKEALKPTKYLKLNRILDPEQQTMVMKLLEVIEQYSDDPDPEDESEGEDE